MKTEVIIIGAGLTGLTLGYLLQQKGVSFKIIEARDRVGGRIQTILSENRTPIEMGATWISKQHTELNTLLEQLEIPVFEQFMDGIALFEPLSAAPPQQFHIPNNQEPSYRIAGGTNKLIDALTSHIDTHKIVLNEPIITIKKTSNKALITKSSNNEYFSKKVITTLPPLLFAKTITCTSLPSDLIKIASKTHTWMSDAIKFGISYKAAFWKELGFSGTLFSNVGPIIELYDHSSIENTKYALKGFLQSSLSSETLEQRKNKVIRQLQKVFGDQVLHYLSYEEVIWKNEPYTHIDDDHFIFPHQNNGHSIYQQSYLDNQLFIAGSEISPQFGGYMEGAIRSAYTIYKKLS